MDYPRELLQIHGSWTIHRDTHPSPRTFCDAVQATWGQQSSTGTAPIAKDYKAGALQEGLESATTGAFVARFDADFCRPTDFSGPHIHHFRIPKVESPEPLDLFFNSDFNLRREVPESPAGRHTLSSNTAHAREPDTTLNFNVPPHTCSNGDDRRRR